MGFKWQFWDVIWSKFVDFNDTGEELRYKGFVVPIDVAFDDALSVDKGLVFSDVVATFARPRRFDVSRLRWLSVR